MGGGWRGWCSHQLQQTVVVKSVAVIVSHPFLSINHTIGVGGGRGGG